VEELSIIETKILFEVRALKSDAKADQFWRGTKIQIKNVVEEQQGYCDEAGHERVV
jgi:hypothetical protein